MVQLQQNLNGSNGAQLQGAAINTNNLVNYNTMNNKQSAKMKLNYDDLKKFLIKEQNSAQV